MLRILKNWSERYFSDEEAVYLLVVLLTAGLVILFFGGMLAPVLASIVIALLFLYMVGAIFIFGAEINAARMKVKARIRAEREAAEAAKAEGVTAN